MGVINATGFWKGRYKKGYGALYNWYAASKILPTSNKSIYGGLYNWYAVIYNVNGASVAPTGCHVPNLTEWDTLRTYLGVLAGGYMKEIGYSHWNYPNTNADNSSGFTAKGAGIRQIDGTFDSIKISNFWWSLFDWGGIIGGRYINYDSDALLDCYISYNQGASVRCLLDGVDPDNPGTVTDIDGNIYPTVKIGTQVWMAANLKVTHYNDGTLIPIITDNTEWANDTSGAMCYYDNSIVDATIAPTGCHVPSKTEWETLIAELGGTGAGGHLKETGYSHWDIPNTGADNSSGFTVLGNGFRQPITAIFSSLKQFGSKWSSTIDPDFPTYAYYSYDTKDSADEIIFEGLTQCGMSIRCLLDGVDPDNPGIITDIDGNIYPTVKIGTQVWMAKNLKVIHYNDGTDIPNITDNTAWAVDTDGAMCYYNNNINNS
jgi:uncharacterized protein (TIGR02145 family)